MRMSDVRLGRGWGKAVGMARRHIFMTLNGLEIKYCCNVTRALLLVIEYIGCKSRTERSRKTKIGTELAHVTRDLDTTFKVKWSRSPGRFTQHGLNV